MSPIGVAINMNGTVIYEVVSAIFIAQFREKQLSFGQIVVVG